MGVKRTPRGLYTVHNIYCRRRGNGGDQYARARSVHTASTHREPLFGLYTTLHTHTHTHIYIIYNFRVHIYKCVYINASCGAAIFPFVTNIAAVVVSAGKKTARILRIFCFQLNSKNSASILAVTMVTVQ